MLLTRTHECLERLRQAEAAQGGVAESEQLDALQEEFSEAARPLLETLTKCAVMRKAGIAVTAPATLPKMRGKIDNAANLFREDPKSSTLKQGKRWPTLLGAVEDLSDAVRSALDASWKAYTQTGLFVGASYEEEDRILAKTPQNIQALKQYRPLYQEFVTLRASPPQREEDLARLRELSEQLGQIEFERKVPPAIRTFLQASSTPQGATLHQLTDEVRKWLEAQNLLDRYVIRPRIS
jgi:hypothetical protein